MTSKYYATSTMKTRDGIIQGTVRLNPSRPREYQVSIDGELVGEFATPEEAVDELKRSGFKNVKITESKITFKQQKLIENYIRRKVKKMLKEDIQEIHTVYPNQIQELFDEYFEKLSNEDLSINDSLYERQITAAQQYLDKSLQILMKIK